MTNFIKIWFKNKNSILDQNLDFLFKVYDSMPDKSKFVFKLLSIAMAFSYLGIISLLWVYIASLLLNVFLTAFFMYSIAFFFLYPLIIDYNPHQKNYNKVVL